MLMNTLTRLAVAARFLMPCFALLLLSSSVEAQQVLSVTPTSVSAQATAGTNAASQTVRVANSGRAALKWSVVQPSENWFSVLPTSGVNTGALTLTFKTSALAVRTTPYQTTFRVNSNGGSVTVTVTVSIVASTAPTLAVTCPSNMTATSSNGSPVVVNYTATTSGGLAPVTWSGSPASGSSFPVGTTPVTVTAQSSDGQTATCGFSVTVNSNTTLVVTCPSNISAASSDGQPVVVTYTATTSGGVAPVTWSGTPTSGSSFPVGSTPVAVTAQSSDGQTANCGFWVIVSYSLPSSTSVGPQATITCPTGAINILPGTNNIQTMVDAYGNGTTFCLKAGVFSVTSPITPKSGDTFVGEYGAVLDGTGWDTTDTDNTHCAFRAYNQDIDNVTIRNLVIRNMRQCAILAFYLNSNNWFIEFNEIASNFAGIVFPSDSLIRNNFIHHNYNLGYQADSAHNSTLENNEISYNGYEQKIIQSANVTFRGNFIHHNEGAGIWYDSDNTGAVIDSNRIEDNRQFGIFYEVSGTATISNNTVRRSGDTGIFISTSRDSQIYNNTLENNFRGITYLVNCPSVGGGQIFFDLRNNSAHDNTIVVGTQSGAFASAFASVNCSSSQVQPYQSGSKSLTFSHNSYDVPSPTTVQYWFYFDVLKYWPDWQALGQDTTGTVQ
jgi:parallel beta-helix repeat protein